MKNQSLLKVLQKVGLSEKESQVYFSSLTLGPSTVLSLSNHSQGKRSTVYSINESLRNSRLIRKEFHGLKEYYVAAEPDKLERLLDEQKGALFSILPQLQALQQLQENESVIKYYEGVEALKTVYLEILDLVKSNQDYYVLSDSKKWFSLDPEFFLKFKNKRSKLDITVKQIFSANYSSSPLLQENKKANEIYKFLPRNSQISTNLVIIPQRVFVHSLVPPFIGMVIENKPLIQMHREMYNVMWNSLPEQTEPY